jgi:hypothetical protein
MMDLQGSSVSDTRKKDQDAIDASILAALAKASAGASPCARITHA